MGGRLVVAVCRTIKTGLSFVCKHECLLVCFIFTNSGRIGETQVLLSRLRLILLTLRGTFPTAVQCTQSAATRFVSVFEL